MLLLSCYRAKLLAVFYLIYHNRVIHQVSTQLIQVENWPKETLPVAGLELLHERSRQELHIKMAGTKSGSFKQGQIPLLDDLPTEILIMIMKNCPNISSLWSLISASSRLNSIFMAVAREVVEYVITETAPVRVRNHMRIVLMICTTPKSLLGIDDMVEYMSEDFVIEPMAQKVSPQVLRDFVELSHIVHGIAHACLDFYVEKILKDMKPRCLNDTEIDQVYKNKKQPIHKFDGLEGHPYQPACSGPPSYLEEQTAIRLLWRVQIYIDLKAAWKKGTLAHWPEEELAGFGMMSMLDFLELSSVPGRGRSRLSYEQEQLFTLANFVNEDIGEKPQEVEES